MLVEEFLERYQSDRVKKRMFVWLLADRLRMGEAQIRAYPERELPADMVDQLCTEAQQLIDGRPEAYVFGHSPFMDARFLVDERALIPRTETEHLCLLVTEHYAKNPPKRILDLCCGAGPIGLSLARKFPNAQVLLTDISQDALDLAEDNIAHLDLDPVRVQVAQGDLWAAVPEGETFDVIMGNPPYVGHDDLIDDSVADHEPDVALYSDDHGMAHIKRILGELPKYLAPQGVAAFELSFMHNKRLTPWLEREAPLPFRWQPDQHEVMRFLFLGHDAEQLALFDAQGNQHG